MNLTSEFFKLIQKACFPGIWSKGVALKRTGSVLTERVTKDELTFSVHSTDRLVGYKVTLWPGDEDWYCDCDERNQVCAHVVAVAIMLNTEKSTLFENSQLQASITQVQYRFFRRGGELVFERWIRAAEEGRDQCLISSLVGMIGGIESGRIKKDKISVIQSDFAVDAYIMSLEGKSFNRSTWIYLFKLLADCNNISLDGKFVAVSPHPFQFRACIIDEGTGFRLKMEKNISISETFKNGAVLCGEILRGVEAFPIDSDEKMILSQNGKYFSQEDAKLLVLKILPNLQKKISVNILTQNLPSVRKIVPQIILQIEMSSVGIGAVSVVPRLTSLRSQTDNLLNEVLVEDHDEEKRIIQKLKEEMQLIPGQRVTFSGDSAAEFLLKAENWQKEGVDVPSLTVHQDMLAKIYLDTNRIDIAFESSSGFKRADSKAVINAWKENSSYVALVGGGWGKLPKNWLEKYGKHIQRLFDIKEMSTDNLDQKNCLPNYLLPEAQRICEELNQPVSEAVKKFNYQLSNIEQMKDVELPEGVDIRLRAYQIYGIKWLQFLKNSKMGALLADDMGLGKTVQAIFAIGGKTLVVSPTSVMHAWIDQLHLFRPDLKVSLYYGQDRQLDREVDVVLTSYALLRLDLNVMSLEQWDTIIIDEAQTIKNPQSQVTKAVHCLNANSRIALSGTPVENRLEDLWSQFQFLNPGLLGSLEGFQQQFCNPIARGDQEVTKQLRDIVKPFILRRLKKEVAPELPPRIEKVLYCELNDEERQLYESIIGATKIEVLQKLKLGSSVFAALELLLRLRQACCHSMLLPGQSYKRSSKVDLLIDTLNDSIACGHRSLVFSQWTSYLDLIQLELIEKNISFSRLDGNTKNRDEVVRSFQSIGGPSVLLISLKAGGVGLTLTAADHVFIMDPWWNPAVEDQAADRVHRIGQTQGVLIHRLVAQDTIEERILELKNIKKRISAAILDDGYALPNLTRDDIIKLFS